MQTNFLITYKQNIKWKTVAGIGKSFSQIFEQRMKKEMEKKNPYVPRLNIFKANKQCGNESPMEESAIDEELEICILKF